MSLDPLALAAQVAHNLVQLQEAGFVDQSRVNDLLEVLPVPGKANWAWTAQADDELTLAEDEEVIILKREGEWWVGRNAAGQTGSIPHNYVLPLPYPPLRLSAPPPPIPSRKSSTISTISSDPSSTSSSVYTVPPPVARVNSSNSIPSGPVRRPSGYSDRDFATDPLRKEYEPTRVEKAGGAVKARLPGMIAKRI